MTGSLPEPPAARPELISVVIVNYNRRDDLREALRSVRAQDYPNIETIVVDNASHDGSRGMIAAEFPEVRLIASDQNLGMDGYSVGFRAALGPYVFQMDNDSELPDPTVLSQVVECFRRGPERLGVVATRIEEYRRGIDDIEELRGRTSLRGPFPSGGFHSGGVGFRRSALDEVGYYNRDVFLYCAEMFVQMQFLAGGYSILYYPEILVLHKFSPVARSERFLYYHVRNRCWFMRLFATPAQRLRFLPPMLLYDLGQAFAKRLPGTYLRAVWEGLGPIPKSLKPLRSTNADFVAGVNEIGRIFRPGNLLRRIKRQLAGR